MDQRQAIYSPPSITNASPPISPPISPLAGIKVLVVDDSDFNREFAQILLENNGAVVSLATDGQDALFWLNAHPDGVDLILMDIQMPIMDGYTATQNIRQNPQWLNLPIIALTAGVLPDELALALAVGMNDFVGKPLDVDHLITTIQRLTTDKVTLIPIHEGASPVSVQVFSRIDVLSLPGIDIKEGLKQWGNEAAYRAYLKKFIETYQNTGFSLAELITQGNFKDASSLAHKIKGVAANL